MLLGYDGNIDTGCVSIKFDAGVVSVKRAAGGAMQKSVRIALMSSPTSTTPTLNTDSASA